MSDKPVVLFACIHNSGRSVAARVLTEHYAKGAVEARSAGSEPKDSVNPVVAEVLADRGLSTAGEKPTKLDYDVLEPVAVHDGQPFSQRWKQPTRLRRTGYSRRSPGV
jgi:arsenate reductase (thioredoxin)